MLLGVAVAVGAAHVGFVLDIIDDGGGSSYRKSIWVDVLCWGLGRGLGLGFLRGLALGGLAARQRRFAEEEGYGGSLSRASCQAGFWGVLGGAVGVVLEWVACGDAEGVGRRTGVLVRSLGYTPLKS